MGAKTFGERVKAAREAAGISQGELERRLGLESRGYVSMLESNQRGKKPSEDFVSNVARALGVTRDALVADATHVPRRAAADDDPCFARAQYFDIARTRGADESLLAALRRAPVPNGAHGDPTTIEFWHGEYMKLKRAAEAFAPDLGSVGDELET